MREPARLSEGVKLFMGPTFLVEYDNARNNANHIHSVWRDFVGDFGADLLAEHYAACHNQNC